MTAIKLIEILRASKARGHGTSTFPDWWENLHSWEKVEILDQIDNAIIKDAKEGGE